MRVAFVSLILAALCAAVPQGVTSAIAPAQSPPPGCSPNYDGSFLIGPVNVSTSKRSIDARNTKLGISMKNGILTDPQGRIGYIASNQQFQFDDPPQLGAIWTAGFSVCENGSLALGDDVIWWKCLSGSFYNLYFKTTGSDCIESYLITHAINSTSGPVPVSNTPSASGSTGTRTTPPGNAATTDNGPTTSTSSTSTSNKQTSNGGLPTGAKIGVGVGVGVGVGCLLLAFAAFLYLRRRLYAKNASSGGPTIPEMQNPGDMPVEERPQELAAGRGELPELPVKERPQELSSERY